MTFTINAERERDGIGATTLHRKLHTRRIDPTDTDGRNFERVAVESACPLSNSLVVPASPK